MNNGKILQKSPNIDLNVNHACYLLNKNFVFYFEGQLPRLQYKGQHVELSRKQAKVLRYLCDNPAPVTIKTIINATGAKSLDKEKLMKLVFELNNKFRHLDLPHAGISLNGDEYQLNYQTQLSTERDYHLKQMRSQKILLRLFVFTAVGLMLVLNFMP
jgi:hypothetical protein